MGALLYAGASALGTTVYPEAFAILGTVDQLSAGCFEVLLAGLPYGALTWVVISRLIKEPAESCAR